MFWNITRVYEHFQTVICDFLKPKLYRTVIEDVINDVREVFLDASVDEQVLVELRTVSYNFMYLK